MAGHGQGRDVGQQAGRRGIEGQLRRQGIEHQRQLGAAGVAGAVDGDHPDGVLPLAEGQVGEAEAAAVELGGGAVDGQAEERFVDLAGDGDLRGFDKAPRLGRGDGDHRRDGIEIEDQGGGADVAGGIDGGDGDLVAPLGEAEAGQGKAVAAGGHGDAVDAEAGPWVVDQAGEIDAGGVEPVAILLRGKLGSRRDGVGGEGPGQLGEVAGTVGEGQLNAVPPFGQALGRLETDAAGGEAGRGADVGAVQSQAHAGRIDPGAAGLVGIAGSDAGGGGGEQRTVGRLRGGDDGRGDVAVFPQDADAQEGGHLEIAAFEDHLQVVDPGGGDRRLEVVVLLLEVLLPEDLDAVDKNLCRRDAAGLAVAVPHPQQGLVGGFAALEAFSIDRRRPLEPVEVDRPEEWQVGPGQNGSGQEQAQGCQA